MDLSAVQLLCLEQEQWNLKDHTRDFLDLPHPLPRFLALRFFLLHQPDPRHACPVMFLWGISPHLWSGPWWTTDRSSPSAPLRRILTAPVLTQSPASCLLHCTEPLPEPTADTEPVPATMPVPETTHELNIALEPEPHRESDQMRDLAPTSLEVDILVEYEGMEWSPIHTPAAISGLWEIFWA